MPAFPELAPEAVKAAVLFSNLTAEATMQLGRIGPRPRLTRLAAPAFLVASIVLWLIAPSALMSRITPLAGTVSLLCAGLYLAGVVLRILRFTRHHRERLTANAGTELARLWKAVYVMTAILVATFAMSAAFYVSATRLLASASGGGEARLLWMLTLGGLALSVGFGRLVIILVDLVDAAMTRIDTAGPGKSSVEDER